MGLYGCVAPYADGDDRPNVDGVVPNVDGVVPNDDGVVPNAEG